MIPPEFRGFHAWPEGDDQARADWLVARLDEDPQHAALIAMPVADNDEELDELEENFRRAFEVARARGRRLGVKFLHGKDVGRGVPPVSRVLVFLHEHKFVGGQCVNGCKDTEPLDDAREVDDYPEAA